MTTPRRVPRHQRLDAAPVLVGTYTPGTSVIHRLPAGAKIFVVIGFSLVVGCVRTVPIAIGALVVAIILWASAALSWRTLMGLWPLVFVVGPMAGYHVWRGNPMLAFMMPAGLIGVVIVATVVSRTTSTTDITDLVTRASARVIGVRAATIVALTISLTLRMIPVLLELIAQTRSAVTARGATPTPSRVFLPVVLRATKFALDTADALDARGALDEDDPSPMCR